MTWVGRCFSNTALVCPTSLLMFQQHIGSKLEVDHHIIHIRWGNLQHWVAILHPTFSAWVSITLTPVRNCSLPPLLERNGLRHLKNGCWMRSMVTTTLQLNVFSSRNVMYKKDMATSYFSIVSCKAWSGDVDRQAQEKHTSIKEIASFINKKRIPLTIIHALDVKINILPLVKLLEHIHSIIRGNEGNCWGNLHEISILRREKDPLLSLQFPTFLLQHMLNSFANQPRSTSHHDTHRLGFILRPHCLLLHWLFSEVVGITQEKRDI